MIPTFTIGDRLRKARETTGMSQMEFAETLGLGRSSVQNYEAGQTSPKRIALKAWSMATGVPVAWLEFGVVPGEGDGNAAMAGSGKLPQLDSNQQPAD